MNPAQFARMLVRLIVVVLVVTSAVRGVDFILSLALGGHFNFRSFVSGILHSAVPAGAAAVVFALAETITQFLHKGNES